MFRSLLRKKNEIPNEECIGLLENEKRGVLSVLGDMQYPYGMPMNHFYNADDGCIYFHCGRTGHRLDSLKKHSKVSFCLYDGGYKDGDGWALNIRSVIVFGKIDIIEDYETVVKVTRRLCYKFTDDDSYIDAEIAKAGRATVLLKLVPEHICGKIVNEA